MSERKLRIRLKKQLNEEIINRKMRRAIFNLLCQSSKKRGVLENYAKCVRLNGVMTEKINWFPSVSFHQRSFKTLATKPIDKHFWRYNDRSCSIPSRMISNVAKDQSEALKEKEEAGAVPSEVSGDEKAEIESLIASLAEKEVEIEEKKAEVEKLKDGLLRSYAEMENLRERTRREVDSSKKFAVQSFAKDLLDVSDNLERAVSVVPEKYKVQSQGQIADNNESAKILNSLLEGVVMTQNQLLKVFGKHGLKRYEPIGETFDPNLHNALFEVPDSEKDPGTIAVVTKVGYTLYDRVIRPAEVGVFRDPTL